jgi:hypothetical protein
VRPGLASISLKVSTGLLITSHVLNGRFIFFAIFSSLQRELIDAWSSAIELYPELSEAFLLLVAAADLSPRMAGPSFELPPR